MSVYGTAAERRAYATGVRDGREQAMQESAHDRKTVCNSPGCRLSPGHMGAHE